MLGHNYNPADRHFTNLDAYDRGYLDGFYRGEMVAAQHIEDLLDRVALLASGNPIIANLVERVVQLEDENNRLYRKAYGNE